MRSITSFRRSRRNAGQQPEPSSLPSQRNIPSKKDRHRGGAAIPPSVPSITLATVNAANAAAVAAANPCISSIALADVKSAKAAAVAATNHRVSIEFFFTPLGDVLEPVSSTLPAGAAAFSADIMPTVVLTPGAKLASPDAVAADVSVATTVAPSKLVTAKAEAEVTDVTVPSLESANLATAEIAATADLPVPKVNANAASFSGGISFLESVATVTATEEAAAADVTFQTVPSSNLATAEVSATANIVVPIDTAAVSSKGMAFIESTAAGVCFGTADSITDHEEVAALDVSEGHIQKKGVSVMCLFCINSYLI
jgi:hypothetical protein